MIFLKYLVVVILISVSVSVSAEEITCPDGEILIPYHNSCMAVPETPTCPEGETWIPYHRTCAVLPASIEFESGSDDSYNN